MSLTPVLALFNNVLAAAPPGQAAEPKKPTPKEFAQRAVKYAYPPVHWTGDFSGVTNFKQALLVAELIRSGVITKPEQLAEYAAIWQSDFDLEISGCG